MFRARKERALTGSRKKAREDEFKVLFAVCFLIFMVTATASRIVGWLRLSDAGRQQSVIDEAEEQAAIVVGYVSMS